MVDFGAGVGDIAQSAIRTARAHGWRLEVIATDRNREIVELGRSEVTEECISFLHADILDHSGTIAPKSADVAHASLMLHHLRDDKVVTALRSMATVARKLLIWNDLIFARVRCDECSHEYLLAFSCKGRWFCPSCHQKKVQVFGTMLAESILAAVPHRHFTFTIPKMGASGIRVG